jgi:AcrR family transcriptional regulator
VAKQTIRVGLSRDAIIDAALELIGEVGVDKLSMRQLSARLGVSLGATYRYVPTKEALLALCGRALYDRSYRPRNLDEDPLDWVREEVMNLYDLLREHPGMAGYVIQHNDLVSPELAMAVAESLSSVGLNPSSVRKTGLVLTFYIAGAVLTDSGTVLAAMGVNDPRAMVSAGIDFILRGGQLVPDQVSKRAIKRTG